MQNKTAVKEVNKIVLKEVQLDACEVMEEAMTPSFGFGCPNGWFGAYCH
ncbi:MULTISPECIES: hypothetical protein [Paenibacillus]|nr:MULTISPECIES: hypothetical protein [Paenibacillus]